MRHMRFLRLPLILAVTLPLTALAAIAVTGGGMDAPNAQSATAKDAHPADGHDHADDPAHQQPPFLRTLAVHRDAKPGPSAHPERMRASLVAGDLPRRAVEATVVTDEDCAPDARGVSNCRNQLRLPDGRKLAVRHPHRMAEVPCMTPGEIVRLRPRGDA